MSGAVRSSCLTRFAAIATECGLDAPALVEEAGLPQACLAEADLCISFEDAANLLELAAERAGEPAFALRMVDSRRLSSFGVLGALCRDAPTLRAVMQTLARHSDLQNEALNLWLVEADGLAALHFQVDRGSGGRYLRQATELAVGATYHVLSGMFGGAWHGRACFSHPAPKDRSISRRILGHEAYYDHEFHGIVCRASDLELPNASADPEMVRYMRPAMELALHHEKTLSSRVRAMAIELLPSRRCQVQTVARAMGVTRRTVAAHLAGEGTTFSAVVNQVRSDLLASFVAIGSPTVTELSALLGFATPSSFSRWHRAQFDRTAQSRLGRRSMPSLVDATHDGVRESL